jgi:DNA-binding CsgD family transcriptional regulator
MEAVDVLELLDVAYTTDGSDADWMRGVVERAHRHLDRGMGITGYQVDARGTGFRVGAHHSTAPDRRAEQQRFTAWRERAPDELKRHAHLYWPVGFASQLPVGNLARVAFEQSFAITGHADVLGIAALDASQQGCALAAPYPDRQTEPLGKTRSVVWQRVAAHLAAALRLRRTRPTPDAILHPGGRVAHAEGSAKRPDALERLRRAAQAYDAARSRSVREGVDVVEAWRALVAGRWSLVETFESDGRRYLIARPNAPAPATLASLTPRETQVLRAAALGHANKFIAYELGIAPSTVSGALARAARKLGARDRDEVIRMCAGLVATPRPTAHDES